MAWIDNFLAIFNPGLTAVTGVTTALLERERTEIKQKCGNRPIFPGNKRDTYDNCVKQIIESRSYNYELTKDSFELEKEKALIMQKTVLYIIGAIIVLAILYFVVKKIF